LLYLFQKENNNSSIQELDITIQADNDFYSLVPHLEERNLDRTLQNASQLPAFLPAAVSKEGKIYKTGLGSSACLVTSVVGALCHAVGCASSHVIYNLAQICHCHAQGKVGSGFDVSAACNGSHVYQRFPTSILTELLFCLDSVNDPKALLARTVEATWDGGVAAPLPGTKWLQVVMADVAGGSESPSMARTVLAWKKKQQTTTPIPHWDDLVQINQTIVNLLQQLAGLVAPLDKQEYIATPHEEWNSRSGAGPLLYALRRAFLESRHQLKAMGEAAGVPIEPDKQTALADATMEIPGVIAALVPGAGGYDALACLYIDDDQVRLNIGELWTSWTQAKVCPLTVQAADYGDGVRVEPCLPDEKRLS
jgi:phosphomevalonate kinase